MKKKGNPEGGAPKASKNAKQKQRRKRKKEQKAQEARVAQDEVVADGEEKLPKPQWSKGNKKQQKKKQEDYQSQSEEDYSDTQQERKNEYRKGGYHPVNEGELYNNRYRVVKKLGWGYFSTVWLCWDHEESNFKAIKIQKSATHYREAAFDEITLLTQIREGDVDNSKSCCRLTDHFEHKGPNGQHVVMVFEVLGENLLELIMKYDYKGIPVPIVKSITRQVLVALDYLHRELQIIHTDVKPENVVVAMPQKAVQQVMESYSPPTDRYKQLTLAERDPTSLTKAQKKRLRKKLKMQQKDAPSSDTRAAAEDEEEDEDDEKEGAESSVKSGANARTPEVVESIALESAEAISGCRGDERVLRDAAQTNGMARSTANANEPQKNEETVVESVEEALKRYSHVKIVDFGNACWTYRHFTEEIQTRQYRAPEVIVRNGYHTSADVWSFACMVFELLTGDFLFDPQESEYIDRDEDHLALIVELLQTQPQVPGCLHAKGSNEFINSQGYLRHINHLKFWDLKSVLHEKYKFRKEKAAEIADFLLPMLSIDPSKRATAQQALKHPWLQPDPTDWEPFMLEEICPDDNPPKGRYRSEEEWEGDEESEDEGLDFGDGELPEGMTPDMYRACVQQQMELLQLAEARAREAGDFLHHEDLEDIESDGPTSPAPGSPHSDPAALSYGSESGEPSPPPGEDEGDSPQADPPAEIDAEAGVGAPEEES
eukprot:GGOE01009986.1.p1 GENE.GGOE01009986.1~~GGOE01009986.1.p1  ORF type:complete len:715 (+),score=150.96 GGOE01009986.1:58-2202(+)